MNTKTRVLAILLLLGGLGVGYFDYLSETNPTSWAYRPFRLGLDLSGGSQLIYDADTSKIDPSQVGEAMSALREVIERRVNAFGVGEPIVQAEQVGIGNNAKHRLIVELPGVTDLKKAQAMINETPSLEFRIERPDGVEKEAIRNAKKAVADYLQEISTINASTTVEELNRKITDRFGAEKLALAQEDADFMSSGFTGKYLKSSTVQFNQDSIGPSIGLAFNDEGVKLFAKITEENVNKKLAIFLDGKMLSAPVIREPIRDGKAEISGQFTVTEAKTLVRNLNLGALPVPVSLASTQTIGATLGEEAMKAGVKSGLIGLIFIALFMLFWYRLPGLIAVISLSIYVALVLAIFKLIPVTLTAAGIAGFILSLGIAVDANVLIFERLKEEIRNGKNVQNAVTDGFARAWSSIRDSNISTILSSVILFWFGSSLIRGFGLNLAIGVIISMFTAITVTRTLLFSLGFKGESKIVRFLFSSGFTTAKNTNQK